LKRRALERHLKRHGCKKRREGGNHTIWRNPDNGATAPVPRHSEIADVLAKRISRELGIPPP
jgi:mRNA interferase HicA